MCVRLLLLVNQFVHLQIEKTLKKVGFRLITVHFRLFSKSSNMVCTSYFVYAHLCLYFPPDPLIGQLQIVVVGIVIPSVCMCMLAVVGYFLYRYLMGKGQKSPYILVKHTHAGNLTTLFFNKVLLKVKLKGKMPS